MTPSRWNRHRLVDALALALVLALGLGKLAQPFMGDQALFVLMGELLARGGVLYRDLWDLKQPGIFGFYLAAGTLFGFTEIGVHAFELVYMTAFSVILMRAGRDLVHRRLLASAAPLLTVGVYYALAGVWHQTQVEALVTFPLFLALWFQDRALKTTGAAAWWQLASGLAGGVVLLFKFLFLPILLAFWLTAAYEWFTRRPQDGWRRLAWLAACLIAGAAMPLFALLGYLAWHQILPLAWWTFVEAPGREAVSAPSNLRTLGSGLWWFVRGFAPLLALGTVGAFAALRRERTYMGLNLVLWVLLGLGVILVQRVSWWQYHYMLLFVPVGLLALKGLEVLTAQFDHLAPPAGRREAGLVTALVLTWLFIPLAGTWLLTAGRLARHGFGLTEDRRLQFQMSVNPKYAEVRREIGFLPPEAGLADIYVFGDPLYYYLAERQPPVPYLATWFRALPETWTKLLAELDRVRPRYVYVANTAFDEIRSETTPRIEPFLRGTEPFISARYRIHHRSGVGTWYVLRDRPQHAE